MFRRYVYVEGLTSLVGSNNKFLINYLGQVKDVMGNDVPFEYDSEGHRTVFVHGWDGVRNYRIIDLMSIQYKDLRIPKELYGEIVAFVINGDKDDVSAKNIGYRFKSGKLEVPGLSGYYYVPGFTSVAINAEGLLSSTKTLKPMTWSITKGVPAKNIKGGYYAASAAGCHRKMTGVLRHRAMCLVFKEYPDNADDMVVNHKNGIPGDDRLENLEWVTRGQNNKHAYELDLKNQHKRVLVRNARTGEVTEYYSLAECARQLGLFSNVSIMFRLKAEFSKVFEDGYQFKLKDEEREWVIPENVEAAIKAAQEKTAIKARRCSDLEELFFESSVEAGKVTGANQTTIFYRIKKDDRSPLMGYQFGYAEDDRGWPSFTKEELQESFEPFQFGVEARNLLTNEEMSFASVNKARKHFGAAQIAFDLREGKQPLLPSGWQFKLAEQAWEQIDDFEKALYGKIRKLMVREEASGKVFIFESCRAAGKMLGFDPKMIKATAMTRGHKLWRGYRFRLDVTDEAWPS